MTTLLMPMCIICKHYKDDMKCDAFPDRIPQAIFWEHADHRRPFKGDNGIRFELDEKHADAADYIVDVYGEDVAD